MGSQFIPNDKGIPKKDIDMIFVYWQEINLLLTN